MGRGTLAVALPLAMFIGVPCPWPGSVPTKYSAPEIPDRPSDTGAVIVTLPGSSKKVGIAETCPVVGAVLSRFTVAITVL